ncbi:phage minor head protein [Rhodovulum sp. FJ3]|uniref:phage minor head protein n=1 Tax=Rhodovulum sp. FJ3 TaxID=3079053 RepID=UPI00293DD085|nr:phage minor head protein [Rhodovulum sp. FJ3]MDV4167812.1 phage minor head protein [Rhodovulum sp. FJ3]
MARKLPREIREALEKLEPDVRAAFEKAIAEIRAAAQFSKLTTALRDGNIETAIEALRIEEAAFTALGDSLRAAYTTGGTLALSRIAIRDPFDGSKFVLGFNGRAVRAEAWVSQKAGTLIAGIVEDQIRMARAIILAGVEQGRGPKAIALDLVGRINPATGRRAGGLIGLTEAQAQYVDSMRTELAALDRGYFRRELRDKRFDGTVLRALKDGKALSKTDIDRIAGRYKDRLLAHRGETIARTEAITALRAGRSEGFRQLVDSGRVRSDQIERGWTDTGDGRTRPDHREMDGTTVTGMDEPFTLPDGSRMMFPGDASLGASAHQTINCRCWEQIRIKSNLLVPR